MGIDTKALLKGNINPIDIANDLANLYGAYRPGISVQLTLTPDVYQVIFRHAIEPKFGYNVEAQKAWEAWRIENTRMMFVHVSDDCDCDYEDVETDGPVTYVSLGCWGDSVAIMKTLLAKYGGWLIENDSIDDWTEYKEEEMA